MGSLWTGLSWFLGIVLKALFGQVRQGVDEARDDQAHEDLGVLRQKQADSEATKQAVDEANSISLEARDREKTKGRLRNGTF